MFYKQGRTSIAAACFPFLKAELPWSQHTLTVSTGRQLVSELHQKATHLSLQLFYCGHVGRRHYFGA